MSFKYPKQIRNKDKTYGPTSEGHFYKSVDYHKKNALKRKDKTRWSVNENAEFYSFKISDENNWLCNTNEKLFTLIDEGSEILGENGERLALFWPPKNENEAWHGFPIFSQDFLPSSELLDTWVSNKVIPHHVRMKIENRKL